MRWTLFFLLGLVLAVGLPACGGGGDGDEGDEVACDTPGVLRKLAVAGEPAPGTAGAFGAFPIQPPMAAARGGWVAFVAPVNGAAEAQVAYVAQPDGALVDVFAVTDVVPSPGDGTIQEIEAVRVNPTGRVIALVTILGDSGSRTRGILSALVTGGAATEKHGVVYNATPATVPLSGDFADFIAKNLFLADDGFVIFEGTTTTGDEGICRAASDGSSVALLAGTGTSVSGTEVDTIEDVVLGPAWASYPRYAFLAERVDGAAGIYVGVIGETAHPEIVEEGDSVDSDTIDDLPAGQALSLSGNGWVFFRAVTDLTLDLLMVGVATQDPLVIVEEGQEEPNTGAAVEDPRWLRNHFDAEGFMFQAELEMNSFGIDRGIWGVSEGSLSPRFLISDGGAAASLNDGELFGPIFPGLGAAGRYDLGPAASLAFANVLNSGRTGLFWRVPGIDCLITTIALGGQAVAGDTFDGTDYWRAATAGGVVIFRAPLVTAGSGIFRQGPN